MMFQCMPQLYINESNVIISLAMIKEKKYNFFLYKKIIVIKLEGTFF